MNVPKRNKPTSKSIQSLCPKFMQKLERNIDTQTEKVLIAWPQIIGERLAPMTRAERIEEGVLFVVVSNSTLLSLLAMKEKRTLLKKIREKFPKAAMKDIRFRIG